MRRWDADSAEIRNGSFRLTGVYAFQHPTGTGPFRLKEWQGADRLVLQRNRSYWGAQPKLDQLTVTPIASPADRLQALQSRGVNAIDLVAPEQADTVRSNSRLKLVDRPALDVGYVAINQSNPPMDKLKVREAVAYGLDRAGVVASFFRGRGVVANEFLPPGLLGYEPRVAKYSYNPTRAKQLLRQAGLTLPVQIDFWYPTNISRPYMPNPKLTFGAFAGSLEESGFRVVAHSTPWRTDYLARVNTGEAGDLALIGLSGSADPDSFLGTLFQGYRAEFGLRNARISSLLDKAERERSATRRAALYREANRVIMRTLPGVPYVHARPAAAVERRFQNLIAGGDTFSPVFFDAGQ
jgi:peptide/nickel transport system substrate-binding protein